MNKLVKLVFAASAVVALSAQAQGITDIQANKPNSAYVQDVRGTIVRDPFGLCWRTGYWTPADAVPGCDGEIVKTVAPLLHLPNLHRHLRLYQFQRRLPKKSLLLQTHSLILTSQY